MSVNSILDGLAHFGCSLERLPDHPLNADGFTMRRHLAKRGLDVPPLSHVADVEPLPAWIQQGMLVVSCPECTGSPNEELGFVWRGGPLLYLCQVCGNAAVGKVHRPVVLPADLDAIEAVLGCRPVGNRTWTTDQTVDDLLTENRRFGWSAPVEVEST